MIYVALLRGVNVGGNNKIDMAKLKVSFEKVGCSNVITYINSGNVVFVNNIKSIKDIKADLESVIKADFDLDIVVHLIDQNDYLNILAHIPNKWQNDDIQKTDIMYLWDELDRPDIIEGLKPNEAIEEVRYVKGAILFNIKRELLDQSRISKLSGTRMYKYMTVRNINTVRRLASIIDEINQK
jgi:uncharacterized protein (DUF1697 family)